MYAKVVFYSGPWSRPSRVFPMFKTDADEFKVAEFEDVLCSSDLMQSIKTPVFDGYDRCNLASIEGSYYWVNSIDNITRERDMVEFGLTYNPVANVSSDKWVGIWDRAPVVTMPYNENVLDSTMVKKRDIELPKISETFNGGFKLYWVQFTTNTKLGTEDSKPGIYRYGFFAIEEGSDVADYTTDVRVKSSVGGSGLNFRYVRIHDLVSNYTHMTGKGIETLLDISISEFCPYKHYSSSSIGQTMNIDNRPKEIDTTDTSVYTIFHGDVHYFRLAYDLNHYGRRLMENQNEFPLLVEEVDLAFTDVEKRHGELWLTDSFGAQLVNFDMNRVDKLYIQCQSTNNGLYVDITANDTTYRIPQGKYPWTGSAWQQYKALDMAYDKEMMNLNIKNAEDGFWVDTLSGLGDAILTGVVGYGVATTHAGKVGAGAGGLSFVGGAINNYFQKEMNVRTLRTEQEAREKHMKRQPSTLGNTSYDGNYITENPDGKGLKLTLYMPNVDESQLTARYDLRGHPSNYMGELDITSGYYKGRLTESPSGEYGQKYDMLNMEINEGVKVVMHD